MYVYKLVYVMLFYFVSVLKGFKIINGYWYCNYIKGNFNFMYFMNFFRIECRIMLYKFWGSL